MYIYVYVKVCGYLYIYIYIYIPVKCATMVKGHPKSTFVIVSTPRCNKECYSFPGLLHFTLSPCLIIPSVMEGSIKYHF